jgi:hypothetical protein
LRHEGRERWAKIQLTIVKGIVLSRFIQSSKQLFILENDAQKGNDNQYLLGRLRSWKFEHSLEW